MPSYSTPLRQSWSRLARQAAVPFGVVCWAATTLAQSDSVTTLKGRVVDFKTGEPIAKALVSVREQKVQAVTNEDGRFELPGVRAGEIELYVSTVGYGLVKHRMAVQNPQEAELEILLGQEALKRQDEITVSSGAFDPIEPGAPSEHTLNNTEIKNLAGVLADDPLRAVQSLPGVSTGDDFNAHFAVRGSGFDSVGFYIDGVLTNAPFHTVRDIPDGGSLTILNGDLVESVSLLSGGAPARYGDRTSAVLNVRTREGSREKFFNRANVSGSGLSFTSEGPLGRSKKVSWLVSARKSYLDWLIQKLSDDRDTAAAFGYTDVQGKLSLHPTERHQIHVTALAGKSSVDQKRNLPNLGVNSFLTGDSSNQIFSLNWRWSPSEKSWLQSLAYSTHEAPKNINRDGEVLFDSHVRHVGIRQDAAYQAGRDHKLEGGFFVRNLSEEVLQRRFDFGLGRFRERRQYDVQAWQPGGYIQDTWSPLPNRLSLTVGGRFDRFTATGENVWLPRASLTLALSSRTRLTTAFGQYAQFPAYVDLYGEFRNSNLRAERSTHYLAAMEHQINDRTRFRIEGYNQEERNRIGSPLTEFRIVNGKIAGPQPGVVLNNAARGYSRGVEVFLQRRSANRLAGWVSYNYGVARLRDDLFGLHFDADFDQRHTLNLYGSWRLTQSLNLSSKYRYGSNFPIVGFYRRQGEAFFLAEQPNLARVPSYSRLDFRVNQAFHFDRWRLTLYGEVLNVLARTNTRYTELNSIRATGEARLNRDSLFPFLPIAGVTIEF